LAAGTLDTIACPCEVFETRIPFPKGGSDAAPIFFGTKSITSVFNADFDGADKSFAVVILRVLRCARKPDCMSVEEACMVSWLLRVSLDGVQKVAGWVRRGGIRPPGRASGKSWGARL